MNIVGREIASNPFGSVVAVISPLSIQVVGFGDDRAFLQGLVKESLSPIDETKRNLWVVQGQHIGPFADWSIVPATPDRRFEGVRGVRTARRFRSLRCSPKL